MGFPGEECTQPALPICSRQDLPRPQVFGRKFGVLKCLKKKIRFCLRLVAKEALPTNLKRHYNHLILTSHCPRYDADIEDVHHLFRACPDSRRLQYYFSAILPPFACTMFCFITGHRAALQPAQCIFYWCALVDVALEE